MIEPIDTLLTGWASPGVWSIVSLPQEMGNRARAAGWSPIVVTAALTTKADFLAAVAQAASFPAWVGNNWDAFEDAITDLSWLPERRVILVLSAPLPDTAVDILLDAARFWDHRRRGFAVIISGDVLEGRTASLPRLDHLPMLGQSPPSRLSGQ